jgi:hypothetical protein
MPPRRLPIILTLCWGGGQTLWLAEDALWVTIVERSQVDTLARFGPERLNVQRENVQRVNVKLSFPGANPQPVLEPFNRLDTHVSYFIGNDPAEWRADVPAWGGVRYRDLYPGVDLIVGAGLAPALDGGQPPGPRLPWRLEARAGADFAAVRLCVEGADAVAVDADALRLSTAGRRPRVAAAGGGPSERATCQRGTRQRAGLRCDRTLRSGVR